MSTDKWFNQVKAGFSFHICVYFAFELQIQIVLVNIDHIPVVEIICSILNGRILLYTITWMQILLATQSLCLKYASVQFITKCKYDLLAIYRYHIPMRTFSIHLSQTKRTLTPKLASAANRLCWITASWLSLL